MKLFNKPKNQSSFPFRDAIIATLALGWLVLAIVDENYRPSFVNLAAIAIGTYLGCNMTNQAK